MEKATIWMLTTRPKTLAVSIAPVTIGFFLALPTGVFSFKIFLITLCTALLIQVGTNFANDYYDCLKGSDNRRRIGPKRGLHKGLISINQMRIATFAMFATALLFSTHLIWIGGWPILCFSLLAPIIGIGYTKGPYALCYIGLADPFVFLFFGPIGVMLTYYLQTGIWSETSFIAGLGPGLLSTAILAIANIRDMEEDRLSCKQTIPVRFGKNTGLFEYAFCLIGAMIIPFLIGSPIASILLVPSVILVTKAIKGEKSEDYVSLLPKTAALLLAYTFLFSIGCFL
jgi:1,4-dihydroxy-2-naphthoate octaprenyltransferase